MSVWDYIEDQEEKKESVWNLLPDSPQHVQMKPPETDYEISTPPGMVPPPPKIGTDVGVQLQKPSAIQQGRYSPYYSNPRKFESGYGTFGGNVQELTQSLPMLGNVIVQTILDIPNEIITAGLHSPSLGISVGEPSSTTGQYQTVPPLYDMPASLFKPEVRSAMGENIIKEILFPWYTGAIGEGKARPEPATELEQLKSLESPEAAKEFNEQEAIRHQATIDADPIRAKKDIRTLADMGAISKELAEDIINGGDARTLGEYWREDPLFVILDAAVILDPLLRIPGMAATKGGKFLQTNRVIRRAAEVNPGFAETLRRAARQMEPGEFLEYAALAGEEMLSSNSPAGRGYPGVPSPLEAFRGGTKPFQKAPLSGTEKWGKAMSDWADQSRPPAMIPTDKGRFPIDYPRPNYHENIAVRGIQYGMEKLRDKVPQIDKFLYKIEKGLGIHPIQHNIDFYMRSLDPMVEAKLTPVLKPLLKSFNKILREEHALFFDILEGVVIDPATELYVMKGGTSIELSKGTINALGAYKDFLDEFIVFHKKMGIPIGETEASWTTRANDLFHRMGGEKGQKKLVFIDEETKIAAVNKQWEQLAKDPKTGQEFTIKWRKRAKNEFFNRDIFTDEISPTKPSKAPSPAETTGGDPFTRGTTTVGTQAKLGSKPIAPGDASASIAQVFKTGEKVYVPEKLGYEDLTVVKDTGRGSVLLQNRKGTILNVGRDKIRRMADAPPEVFEEFGGARPSPGAQGTLRDQGVKVGEYEMKSIPEGDFKEPGLYASEARGKTLGQGSLLFKEGKPLIEVIAREDPPVAASKLPDDLPQKPAPKISPEKPHARVADPELIPESPRPPAPKELPKGVKVGEYGRLEVADGEVPVYLEKVNVENIGADPLTLQYKKGVDPVTGTVIGKEFPVWKDIHAGIVLLWRDKAGKYWIVDGHHRRAWALHHNKTAATKAAPFDALVLYEMDPVSGAAGVTKAQAYEAGAIRNLINENGTAWDAAIFMRRSGKTVSDLKNLGVQVKRALGEKASGLALLDDAAFDYAYQNNLDAGLAAVVGQELKGEPVLQRTMMDLIENGKVRTIEDMQTRARLELSEAIESAKAPEPTLAGMESTADPVGKESTIEATAEIIKAAKNKLKKDKSIAAYIGSEAKAESAGKIGGTTFDVAAGKTQAASLDTAIRLYEIRSTQAGVIKNKAKDYAGQVMRGEIKMSKAVDEFTAWVLNNKEQIFGNADDYRGTGFATDLDDLKPPADAGEGFPGVGDIFGGGGEKGFISTEPIGNFIKWVSESAEAQRGAVSKWYKKLRGKEPPEMGSYEIDGTYWFPHLYPHKTTIGAGVNRTRGLPSKPKRMGHQRRRIGAGDDFIKDPAKIGEILARRLKAYAKAEEAHKELMRHAMRDPKGEHVSIYPGEDIPDGWMAYYPEGVLKFYKTEFNMLEAMQLEVERGALNVDPLMEAVKGVMKDSKAFKSMIRTGGGTTPARHVLIPEIVGERFQAHMNPRQAPQIFRDWRSAWVDGTLAGLYTGRWQVNNLIGNVLMSILDESLWGVPRAMKMRRSQEIMDLIPEVSGGGLYKVMTGGRPWRLYDDSNWLNQARKLKKRITDDVLYEFNSTLDESVRISAFMKRLKPQIQKQMRKQGYTKAGSMILDNVDQLPMDDLAQLMREVFDTDPQLKMKLGQDVAKSVYDFALRSPMEKWFAANTHPFLPWWKFAHAWALHLAVKSPYKLGIMKSLATSAVEINKVFWDLNFGEGIWEQLPDQYKYMIPISGPDKDGMVRMLMVRGANPFHGLFELSQFASGTMPFIQTGLKMTSGFDVFKERELRGKYQATFSGNIPGPFAKEAATSKQLAHMWWLFTGVAPYGNVGDFYMDFNHPYGKYAWATPWDTQPIRDAHGELKYQYEKGVGWRLGRLLGISTRKIGLSDVGRTIDQRKTDYGEVNRRLLREELADGR